MDKDGQYPTVLTVAEIAEYLRVSETTAWRWCQTGKLPAFRIGRKWRVRRADLEHYIIQNTAGLEDPEKGSAASPEHDSPVDGV